MSLKKVGLSLILSLLCVASVVYGQDDPYKSSKKANQLYARYNQNILTNGDKLEEAKTLIGYAVENIASVPEKKVAGVYISQGNINLAIVQDQKLSTKYPDALKNAFDGYMSALKVENAKGYELKSAAKGLKDASYQYWNAGAAAYEDKDYEAAFQGYLKVVEASDVIRTVDEDADPLAGIDEQSGQPKYNGHLEATGFLANLAGNTEGAKKVFEKLYSLGGDALTPSVYDGLFKVYQPTDETKAFAFLKEGREKYPNDQALMYTEINYFLSAGKTKELEERLKVAIEKDPDNKSLYSVLGNTYDNLMQAKNEEIAELAKEGKNADKEKIAALTKESDQLFDEAKKYYEVALEKDPDYFDVLYSLGALNFNKAVRFVNQRNQTDFNDTKNYEKYDAAFKEFTKNAHPYFVKAEQINPNDRSVVIALKECYALANKFEQSNEFKKRLATLAEGGTLEAYDNHLESSSLF